MFYFTTSEILSPKVRDDFSGLICCPVASPYSLKKISWPPPDCTQPYLGMRIICKQQVMHWWTIIGEAYPVKSSSLSAQIIRWVSPSVHSTKKKGDKGSPCLNPLPRVIITYGLSLINTEKVNEDMQYMIQLTQIQWNPKASSKACKYFHSILSYVLQYPTWAFA